MAAPAKRPVANQPELGSFPLDHFRECKLEIEGYYKCLEANRRVTPMCRNEIRQYLQCRMDRGLMSQLDLKKFGLPQTEFVPARTHKEDTVRDAKRGQGTAQIVGAAWEAKFKNPELSREDGYEVDAVTKERLVPVSVGPDAPSRSKGDTI
jgi:cytochrome c oxidase assembly protein subunit 19